MRTSGVALAIVVALACVAPQASAATSSKKVETVTLTTKKKIAKPVAKKTCRTFIECLQAKPRAKATTKKSKHIALGRKAKRVVVEDQATMEVVSWREAAKYKPGSIIIKTHERALYFVLDGDSAQRYRVAVGKEGFQWSGTSRISAKAEWPTWRPPQAMIEREAAKGHFLPDEMEGGPENPLGARAMYLGGTMYRIHGTNNPGSIGSSASSGCIRMMNTDVMELYDQVRIGARVYVM